METKGKCGPALRRRKPDSRNSWTQKGQWNGKMFAYVRLCSPVFAYVRLMREKLVRALSAAAGERWETSQFQISHCEKFDIRLDRRRLRKCSRRCARPLLGIAECESRRRERS